MMTSCVVPSCAPYPVRKESDSQTTGVRTHSHTRWRRAFPSFISTAPNCQKTDARRPHPHTPPVSGPRPTVQGPHNAQLWARHSRGGKTSRACHPVHTTHDTRARINIRRGAIYTRRRRATRDGSLVARDTTGRRRRRTRRVTSYARASRVRLPYDSPLPGLRSSLARDCGHSTTQRGRRMRSRTDARSPRHAPGWPLL
jgi:hypothetical protein